MRLTRRGVVVFGLVVAIAVTAGVLVVSRLSSTRQGTQAQDGADDPGALGGDMPAPARAEARATLSHLQGPGRPLETFRTAAKSASDQPPSQAACRSVAASLNRSASSDTVLSQASQVSDEPYRALLVATRTTLGVYLTSCSQGDMARAGVEHERLSELTSALEARRARLEVAAR